MNRLLRLLTSLDWVLVIVPGLLVGLGLVMIYTLGQAQNRPELFWSQLTYSAIAIVVYGLMVFIDPRTWQASAWFGYLGGLALLGLVLLVGQVQFGAQRWLNFGSFQFQPAELMKALLILLVAHLLAGSIGRVSWRLALAIVGLLAVPVALVIAQPDLGSALVLVGIVGAILLAARLSRGALMLIATAAILALIAGWLSLRDYQRARIETFLNRSPSSETNYNVEQSLIAVGSGGLTGAGIGRGSQSQLNFLPVAHTDFMFATVAEATGLLGATVLILLNGLLIWRCWVIAGLTDRPFAMLIAVGVGSLLLIQVSINVGMNIGLAPVTGIPLPLVSHGGSSLLVTAVLLGLLQSIYCTRTSHRFRGY